MPAPKRLRPGELDGLVLAYMRQAQSDGPLTATAIGKGIKRSAGAVSNCLARLAKEKKVRQAKKRPRGASRWLRLSLPDRLRRATDVPLTHVVTAHPGRVHRAIRQRQPAGLPS